MYVCFLKGRHLYWPLNLPRLLLVIVAIVVNVHSVAKAHLASRGDGDGVDAKERVVLLGVVAAAKLHQRLERGIRLLGARRGVDVGDGAARAAGRHKQPARRAYPQAAPGV